MLILHGDNIILSRKELEFLKEKNKDKEVVVLDGKSLNLTQLKEALEAKSLFGAQKVVIIENFLVNLKTKSLKKETKNLELDYLLKNAGNKNIVLWEGKEINKNLLLLFKNTEIKIFKIKKIIFSLLESLIPGNTKIIINLYRQSLLDNPPELIFSMIIQQFRFLILFKSGAKTGPKKYQNLLPWQKQRLTKQANFFTMEKLREIYQELLDIDYKNKKGRLVFNLEKTLELLLLNI